MLRLAAVLSAAALVASCSAADPGASDLPLQFGSRTPPAVTEANCGNQPTPGTSAFNPDVCQLAVEPYVLEADDGSTATVSTPRDWWEPTERVALEFDCPLAPDRATPVSRRIPYLDSQPEVELELDDGTEIRLLPSERLNVVDCFQQTGRWVGSTGSLEGADGSFVETYNGLQLTLELRSD